VILSRALDGRSPAGKLTDRGSDRESKSDRERQSMAAGVARPAVGSGPAWIRTSDQGIMRIKLFTGNYSTQSLATHAKFQEQLHAAQKQLQRAKRTYEMATLATHSGSPRRMNADGARHDSPERSVLCQA
jgi:hypothetical protein